MYPPANKCIYCGQTDGVLTREHLIPFSLGGSVVLLKASCLAHAEVTSRMEREVARLTYGIHRALTNAPTRRPGKLNSVLNQRVQIEGKTFEGNTVSLEVPVSDVPPAAGVVRMDSPGILRGEEPDATGGYRIEMPPLPDPGLRRLRERLGLRELTGPVSTIAVTSFFRQLAKIGYAFACAELGPDRVKPTLLPLILGEPVSAWHYVGEHVPPRPQSSVPLVLRDIEIADTSWWVVDISLRHFPDMPMYQVVVCAAA